MAHAHAQGRATLSGKASQLSCGARPSLAAFRTRPLTRSSVWIEDGLRLTESTAILVHVAGLCGLAGKDAKSAAKLLMLHGVLSDLRSEYVNMSYSAGESHESLKASLIAQTMPKALGGFEAYLYGDADGPWLLGNELSYMDLELADLLEQLLVLDPGCLAKAPGLTALVTAVNALPAIAAYRASPEFIDRPFNNLMASFM